MEVFGGVLAFAVFVFRWLRENDRARGPRPLAVRPRVFDPHLHRYRPIWYGVAIGDGEATLTRSHLDAMVRNAQPYREAEGPRQPLSGGAGSG